MSFIVDGHTAQDLDVHGAGNLLDNTRVTDQQKDAAWSTLRRHGALDLADMIGVNR